MKSLPKNWITEGTIDFEYKKYQLLAYLKASGESFQSLKLYPPLADLVDHHQNLTDLKSSADSVRALFPKRITKIDVKTGNLDYSEVFGDNEVIKEIHEIADYARPKIKEKIEEGIEIFEFIKSKIEFEPVGILPIYRREGYVLLTRETRPEISVFRFQSSLLEHAGDRFRSISIWLIKTLKKTIFQTMEQIKLSLIREIKELPNPATWRIHSEYDVPLQETLLPISKRLILTTVVEEEN